MTDLRDLEPALDALCVPSWIKDPGGRYLAVGQALAGHLGCDREQMRGREQTAYWPPPAVGQFRADDHAAIARGLGVVVPEATSGGGVLVTVKLPVWDRGGRVVGILGAFGTPTSSDWWEAAETLFLRIRRGAGEALAERGLGGHDRPPAPESRVRAVIAAPGLPAWLEEARSQLLRDFRRRWTVSELASSAGVHPAHLGRRFRACYGTSVHAFLARLRVEWACVELLRSSHPVGRVGIAAGFADHSHFSRTFRRVVGVTPSEYRLTALPR